MAFHRGERARQVRGGDPHHERAVRVAQRLLRGVFVVEPCAGAVRRLRDWCGVHGGEHRLPHLLGGGQLARQRAPLPRVGQEVVRQRRRAAEQREEARAKRRIGRQLVAHLGPLARHVLLQRPGETVRVVQGQVGVTGAGEGPERGGVDKRKLLDVLRGARRDEAEFCWGGKRHIRGPSRSPAPTG